MNCNEVRPLLDLLADSALENKDTALVLDHLQVCPSCKSECDELESLRGRFKELKDWPPMPPQLMGKVSAALDAEDRRARRAMMFGRPGSMTLIAVAASLAIIGLLCIKSGVIPLATPATTLAYKPSSVDEILSREVSGPAVEVVDDRAELDKKLGYDLKYLHLDDWHMKSAGIFKMTMAPPIALFDFVGKSADAAKMRCFQAPLGTFKSDATVAEVVDGKTVRFGSHQDRNYALWSQNGRDYLLVTPLSRDKLTEIVRKA